MKLIEDEWRERIQELEDAMWELHTSMDDIEIYMKNRKYVDQLEESLLLDILHLETSLNFFERGIEE